MLFTIWLFSHIKNFSEWWGNSLCHKSGGLISTSICPRSHTLGSGCNEPNSFHWARPHAGSTWVCRPGTCWVRLFFARRWIFMFTSCHGRERWRHFIIGPEAGDVMQTTGPSEGLSAQRREISRPPALWEKRERTWFLFRAFRNLRYPQHCRGPRDQCSCSHRP